MSYLSFNSDRILKAIESELIRINTCQQSAPVFSESMQILLEKHGYMPVLNGNAITLIYLFFYYAD